jgi:hypothetical protein
MGALLLEARTEEKDFCQRLVAGIWGDHRTDTSEVGETCHQCTESG